MAKVTTKEGMFNSKHLKKLKKLVIKRNQKKYHDDEPKEDKKSFKLLPKQRHGLNFKSKVKKSRSQKLTENCKKHLEYAQFRTINEFIYSNPSGKGYDYMKDGERFKKYHEAYEEIVRKWPVKPIDYIIQKIEENCGPDWDQEWVIADLGCGRIPLIKQKLPKAKVHSFDVVSSHPDVIAANIESVPLADRSVDIAVFSLSLMATNVKDLICEANRILKKKGFLMIAEVSSRLEEETIDKFEEKLTQYGFKILQRQNLPPNDFFVFITATKKKDINRDNLSNLPDINLKPCLYKPR